jgi:hypothetical protein
MYGPFWLMLTSFKVFSFCLVSLLDSGYLGGCKISSIILVNLFSIISGNFDLVFDMLTNVVNFGCNSLL